MKNVRSVLKDRAIQYGLSADDIDRLLADSEVIAALDSYDEEPMFATARHHVLHHRPMLGYDQLGFKTLPTETDKRIRYHEVGALNMVMPRGIDPLGIFVGSSMRFLGEREMLLALHRENCIGFGHRFFVDARVRQMLARQLSRSKRSLDELMRDQHFRQELVILERRYTINHSVELFQSVFAEGAHPIMAVAPNSGGWDHVQALYAAGCRRFGVDVAQGANKMALELSRSIRAFGKEVFIVSGSVDSIETAGAAIEAGADALRIGVGAGNACITRDVAGAGVEQPYAVASISAWAESQNLLARQRCDGTGIILLADGGRDVFAYTNYALALGADGIMFGTSAAHAREASVRKVFRYDRKEGFGWYLEIYGMSSQVIINETRQGEHKPMAEGEVFYRRVRFLDRRRPSMSSMMYEWRTGIGSALSYAGISATARALDHFRQVRIFHINSHRRQRSLR